MHVLVVFIFKAIANQGLFGNRESLVITPDTNLLIE